MISYYSSVMILLWLSLGILCVLVQENNRISRENKVMFYLTYLLIALAALAEWGGRCLNGNTSAPVLALKAVKSIDYILTPMAGGALVGQMRVSNRWRKLMVSILAANAALQIISFFTGWMIKIDADHRYSHGPLYRIYMGICLSVIVLIIIEFMIYGQSFERQNRASLYAIMSMVLIGILMQELMGEEIRTAYISITIGVALLFIHSMEFSQLAADQYAREQGIQMRTDPLTGMQNRYAYTKVLEEYPPEVPLPEDLAAFVIDINELKTTNDTLGHEAGDELICGAARCIEKVFKGVGQCYRTGGDEFMVLAHMNRAQAEEAVARLGRETGRWHGETVNSLGLSTGYALAADFRDYSCERLVKEADLLMLEAKTEYYRTTGKDRRRRT